MAVSGPDLIRIRAMADKGEATLIKKASIMSRNYDLMKSTMVETYDATPFGPTLKANYKDAIGKAVHRVDPEKWSRVWTVRVQK